MARTSLVGNGPVEITTATGDLIAVPLAAFFLDGSGNPQLSGALYQAHQAALIARVKDLIAQNLVGAATSPVPPPVLVLTAVVPGAGGNEIQITFASPAVQDPNNPTVDATLTHSATYTGLAKDTILGAVGDGSAKDSHTEPVFLSTPATSLPAVGSYAVDPTKGVLSVPDATDATKSAFGLTFRNAPDPAATMTAVIPQSDPASNTFTLTVTWKKTLTGLNAAALRTKFFPQVSGAAPPGAAPTDPGIPADGTVVLSGGADAQDPKSATATAMAP
jgi:hypothetical protein